MTFYRNLVFMVLLLSITGCEFGKVPEPSYPNLRQIRAKDRSFSLGLESPLGGSEERPSMRVGFTYNFWIDTTEITIAQYAATTGTIPAKIGDTSGISNRPVTFVSWCDAVLFCNTRSRDAGLDTVYSYTSIERDADGRAYRINGIKANLSKRGFRLPLEAEWEFAAYGGNYTVFPWGNVPDTITGQQYAWFGLNADGHLHDVAQLLPNDYTLYDMFGNALEWVNDFMGLYADDTIINYTGPVFNSKDERSVKGGGYKSTIDKLRPASRTDVYSTYSSTATAYIGFRCCIGPVPSQKGTVKPSVTDTTNPVTLSINDITTVLPRRNAKLVFVNVTSGQNHLCYTDFNEYSGKVYCLKDFSPVYAPVISPDGRWVAFCTRDEGSRDASEIYLRKLDPTGSKMVRLPESPAFLPRWWTDPSTNEVFIVYTTSAVDNATAGWETTATKMQKVVNGQPTGSVIILESSGSFHDGLSIDKKFLATGSTRLKMKNRESGVVKTLFTAPQNGKASGDTSQVCNVSISPAMAHSDRVLFLDFGTGSSISTVVGSSYYTHEVIFMSDFSGDIISWYRCPEDAVEWNHVEWSNNEEFAVATIKPKSAPNFSKYIYLVNLVTKAATQLAAGTELLHPSLWVSPTDVPVSTFTLDSLGYYNEPPTTDAQYALALKLPKFWEYKDSIELLCIGSSRIQNGVAPPSLAPYKTYHLSYSGCGLLGAKNMLENYAFSHCPKLRAVIISIDIGFFRFPQGDDTWNNVYKSKGYQYDASNDFWKSGLPAGFLDALRQVDNPYIESIVSNNGWIADSSLGWGSSPASYTNEWVWQVDNQCLATIDLFESMVSDLEERGIMLIGIIFPMSPSFKNTPVYGTYGPSRTAAEQIISKLQEIDSKYPGFHFYDVNNFGNHIYSNEDAFNASHLSAIGAHKLTTWLKGELDSLFTE